MQILFIFGYDIDHPQSTSEIQGKFQKIQRKWDISYRLDYDIKMNF